MHFGYRFVILNLILMSLFTINGCTFFEEMKKIKAENKQLLSQKGKLEEQKGKLEEKVKTYKDEVKLYQSTNKKNLEDLANVKNEMIALKKEYHNWVGNPEKLYTVTEASLKSLKHLGCPLPNNQLEELNKILKHIYSEDKFEILVNQLVNKMNLDSYEKRKYISCISNAFLNKEPYIEVTISDNIKENLSFESIEVNIVPYNHVNFKLSGTRLFADKRNSIWKNSYSNKIDRYFTIKSDVIENSKNLKKCKVSLQRAYKKYFGYDYDLQKIKEEIQSKRSSLRQTKQTIEDQIASKNIKVLIFAQAKYSNSIKKGVAFEELKKISSIEAAKVLKQSYIDAYSYITNDYLLSDIVKETIMANVTLIPDSTLSFDDYDFNEKNQIIYAVFHFEVNNSKIKSKNRNMKKQQFNTMPNETSILNKFNTSMINDTNKDSFVFPLEIAERMHTLIQLSERQNDKVQKEIRKIKSQHLKALKTYKEEINALEKELTYIKIEKEDYFNNTVVYKIKDLKRSCKTLIDSEKQMRIAYDYASSHGKSDRDGFLYFVLFSEKNITMNDSADSITQKLVDKLYDEITKSLNTAFIKQVTEIENSILSRYSLEINKVRNGEVIEANIILRTQRRSNLFNFFGLGLMFKVKGHVTFIDAEVTYSGFTENEKCFEKHIMECKRDARN